MATYSEWFEIVAGPPREKLFDALRLGRDHGDEEDRWLSFLYIRDRSGTREPITISVDSVGIPILGSSDEWRIVGHHHTDRRLWTANIEFDTASRKGRIQFVYPEIGDQSLDNSPLCGKKERALMIIIETMIARYQNRHSGAADEQMFERYELAKRVHRAEDAETFAAAIREI